MKKNPTVKLAGILLVSVMLVSACTQPYSQAPLGAPTLIPTGLFVSPFPSGQDPLQIVADLGTQTAMAKTAEAGGVVTTGTPGTPGTETGGSTATEDLTAEAAATTPVPVTIAVTIITGGSTFTPTVGAGTTAPTSSGPTSSVPTIQVSVPATYTLQKGEWPYCIARRYNVNPDDLLSLNGLTVAQSSSLMPGLVLTMPQNGDPFPADRAWHSHPDTFTVASSDTTVYGVACYYGDIQPQTIATANNISVSSTLTAGQQLTIP